MSNLYSRRVAQVPRACQAPDTTKRRRVEETEPKVVPPDSVKQEDDGSVIITKVELVPTSSGRERFGARTKAWRKHSLDNLTIQAFIRYVV